MKNITKWYEVRADGVRVAAFHPISREASTKAFKFVQDTRTDLYSGKVLQIVAVDTNFHPLAERRHHEQIIHEEHPTVLEFDHPDFAQTS